MDRSGNGSYHLEITRSGLSGNNPSRVKFVSLRHGSYKVFLRIFLLSLNILWLVLPLMKLTEFINHRNLFICNTYMQIIDYK